MRIEYADIDNISPFDANLMNGVLSKRLNQQVSISAGQESHPLAHLIQQEFENNKLLAGDASEGSSLETDRAAMQQSQSFMLPGAALGRQSPSVSITEEEAKLRRLSNKSRVSLDRKEQKIQGQMKQLVKEWNGIQQVKDSQDIKDNTNEYDDWAATRPN